LTARYIEIFGACVSRSLTRLRRTNMTERIHVLFCVERLIRYLSEERLRVIFAQFLPSDAVRLGGICYGDVAVCVSVTLTYCAQTTESIITRPSPDCSSAVLVLSYQI